MIDPSPAAQKSFEGDNGENLAAIALIARRHDESEIPFRVLLGFPFRRRIAPQDYAVRIELDGLETTGRPIVGIDSIHAMVLAIRFMLSRLDDITKKRRLRIFRADAPGTPFDPLDFFDTIPKELKRID